MASLEAIPAHAKVYLQPTGWCAPDYQNREDWAQIAGLPVWASAVRILVRGYEGREYDRLVPIRRILSTIAQINRDDVSEQWSAISSPRAAWSCGAGQLSFAQTRLMAILNVTPDSFSDGGDHSDSLAAISAAQAMVNDGAEILDIGGESTRPGAKTVWEGDEIERIIPVLQGCQGFGAAMSLDTRKAAVMQAGLGSGAHIINDVSALTYDDSSLSLAAQHACPVILMHAQGDPQNMQQNPRYEDVVLDVYDALEERIAACVSAGVSKARIAIDPGIGFGKTLQHNVSLINNLSIFHGLGCPILLGVSRKRFIGALADEEDPKQRLGGSLSAAMAGIQQGVHMLRVHDVAATRQMLDIWHGMRDALQMPTASLSA